MNDEITFHNELVLFISSVCSTECHTRDRKYGSKKCMTCNTDQGFHVECKFVDQATERDNLCLVQ